ncbi:MAG: Ig-like domain repeat protein, partial [Armatimonadaceae bacterium]
ASAGARSLTITNPDGQTSTLAGALMVNTTTMLVVDDISGVIGSTATLKATLTYLGTPVAGKSIAFEVGAMPVGSATTDASGIATLSFPVPEGAGSRAIGASFAGDMDADAVSGGGTLTITKASTAVSVTSGSVTAGQVATLTATLTRTTDSATLAGKTIAFTFNGVAAGSGTTNGSGVATVSYTVPAATTAGPKTVQASFPGDSNYLTSTGSGSWSTKAITNLVVSAVSTTHLAKPTLKATLKSGTTNLSGRLVTFSVGGVPVGSATTVSPSGLASLLVTATQPVGTHPITVSFAGEADYAASTGSANLTVGKAVTVLSVSNLTVRVGANATIALSLKVGTVPVPGKLIDVTLGGVNIGTVTTNNSGAATLVRKAAEPLGTSVISASFAGDETYRSATKTSNWTVIQSSVKIAGDVISRTAGSSVNYGAKLSRATDNGALAGKTLEFWDTATNTLLGTGVTDSAGRATLPLTSPSKGTKRTFTIRFAGEAAYAAGSG